MYNRYANIRQIKNSSGKRYYVNNIYPDIPVREDDIYVIPVLGDRLDSLAYDFYGDSTLYWVIASANSLSGDSLLPEPGIQLRIPTNIEAVKNAYNNINTTR